MSTYEVEFKPLRGQLIFTVPDSKSDERHILSEITGAKIPGVDRPYYTVAGYKLNFSTSTDTSLKTDRTINFNTTANFEAVTQIVISSVDFEPPSGTEQVPKGFLVLYNTLDVNNFVTYKITENIAITPGATQFDRDLYVIDVEHIDSRGNMFSNDDVLHVSCDNSNAFEPYSYVGTPNSPITLIGTKDAVNVALKDLNSFNLYEIPDSYDNVNFPYGTIGRLANLSQEDLIIEITVKQDGIEKPSYQLIAKYENEQENENPFNYPAYARAIIPIESLQLSSEFNLPSAILEDQIFGRIYHFNFAPSDTILLDMPDFTANEDSTFTITIAANNGTFESGNYIEDDYIASDYFSNSSYVDGTPDTNVTSIGLVNDPDGISTYDNSLKKLTLVGSKSQIIEAFNNVEISFENTTDDVILNLVMQSDNIAYAEGKFEQIPGYNTEFVTAFGAMETQLNELVAVDSPKIGTVANERTGEQTVSMDFLFPQKRIPTVNFGTFDGFTLQNTNNTLGVIQGIVNQTEVYSISSGSLKTWDITSSTPVETTSISLGADYGGIGLSKDGQYLAIGYPLVDRDGQIDKGEIRVYTRSGSSWSLQQTIATAAAWDNEELGRLEVKMSNNYIMARRFDSAGRDSFVSYLRSGTTWNFDDSFSNPGISDVKNFTVDENGRYGYYYDSFGTPTYRLENFNDSLIQEELSSPVDAEMFIDDGYNTLAGGSSIWSIASGMIDTKEADVEGTITALSDNGLWVATRSGNNILFYNKIGGTWTYVKRIANLNNEVKLFLNNGVSTVIGFLGSSLARWDSDFISTYTFNSSTNTYTLTGNKPEINDMLNGLSVEVSIAVDSTVDWTFTLDGIDYNRTQFLLENERFFTIINAGTFTLSATAD